ncbi:MAG: two pore domain potassium channel family protein [Dehalococcoidaceae bacterium]|nr:two pore domain potassium channel family protein [Dehalococcoidaceae bacterium]
MKTMILRLASLFALLSALALVGAFAFMITEDIGFFDALYFTVVTISTVGYGDISPQTTAGRFLAMGMVVLGVAIFLAVVAEVAQLLLSTRQEKLRKQRVHMLIGLFFSEIGNELLRYCVSIDPQKVFLEQNIKIDHNLPDNSFKLIEKTLLQHQGNISVDDLNISKLKQMVWPRGELILRFLENPSLQENEIFTDLLRSVFHLREELGARPEIAGLPRSDIEHLAGDLKRVYVLLPGLWLVYMYYLKTKYSYLYSMAIRTNPFCPEKSVVIEK